MFDATRQPAYPRLLELLRQRIGLDPGSVGTGNIPGALEALGIGDEHALEECIAAMARDPSRLDALVQRIVVHETWFFRDPAAFDVLTGLALRVAASGRRVRVLSAPCSTGEEAYSIAMALVDAGLDEPQFEVVGMDISPQAIAHAQRGVFSELAFRGKPAAWREQHFESEGRLWRMRRRWSAVRFEVGNLLDLPASVVGDRFDAVFCRNLLIYLDAPARERVAASLRRLARPHDGLLCVGPSESTDAFGGRLERVPVGMSFAFWNRSLPPVPTAPATRPAPLLAPVQASSRPAWKPPVPAPPVPAAAPSAATAIEADALDAVRRLADRGDHAAASAACDALLARRPGSADAHALRGMLATASGEPELGVVHLGRALYLDPQHREALQNLALLMQARGELAASRRYQERLQRLLERDTA